MKQAKRKKKRPAEQMLGDWWRSMTVEDAATRLGVERGWTPRSGYFRDADENDIATLKEIVTTIMGGNDAVTSALLGCVVRLRVCRHMRCRRAVWIL